MIEKPNREIIYCDLKTEYCNYLNQIQYVFNSKIIYLFNNDKTIVLNILIYRNLKTIFYLQ